MEGAEFELVWMPTAGLTLNAALGYLDASYDDYTVLDPVGNLVDKSGFDLRRAPELNYSVGANWEFQVGQDAFFVANVNYRCLDNYQIQSNSGGPKHYDVDPTKQPSFGLLDASINFETEHWRLSLFGKNLTDDSYFYHVLDVSAAYAATSATDSSPNYVPGLWSLARSIARDTSVRKCSIGSKPSLLRKKPPVWRLFCVPSSAHIAASLVVSDWFDLTKCAPVRLIMLDNAD